MAMTATIIFNIIRNIIELLLIQINRRIWYQNNYTNLMVICQKSLLFTINASSQWRHKNIFELDFSSFFVKK